MWWKESPYDHEASLPVIDLLLNVGSVRFQLFKTIVLDLSVRAVRLLTEKHLRSQK
jgi:hypothetical protein